MLVHNAEYDIVPYRPTRPPNFNHHGVMNIWLEKQFPKGEYPGRGGDGRTFPTVELSKDNHDAAHRIEKQFRVEKNGICYRSCGLD